MPPDRPYGLGDSDIAADEAPLAKTTTVARAEPTVELAAARAPAAAPAEIRRTSPVSAYAPVRYDGSGSGFMSGRGLY